MRAALLSLALALPLPFLSLARPFLADAQDPAARGGQEPVRGQETPEKKPLPGDVPPEEPRDIFGRPVRTKPKSTVQERLQGGWLLSDIQLNGYPDLGREGSGLLLIQPGYMALELHLTWPQEAKAPDMHQSFIAEYELQLDTILRVNTLIGSFLDDKTGQLQWERSGFAREYELTVTDRNLVLTFGAGNRMSFVKRPATANRARDIYGREVQESASSRDIFGRQRKRTDEKPAEPAAGGGGR